MERNLNDIHFQEYLDKIFRAAGAHARSLDFNDPERDNIFFAIGYTRSYLEHRSILPEQEETESFKSK